MNCDLDEQHQQQANQADSEEDMQEDSHFIIDYEQLRQDIAFYLLTFVQIVFVFVVKQAHSDGIYTDSSSSQSSSSKAGSTSSQQGDSSNTNSSTESSRENFEIVWSVFNIFLLAFSLSLLCYSVYIYRKSKRLIFYRFQMVLNYTFIILLSSYIFSKPSAHQNILFIQYQTPNDKIYEGQSNNQQTEMYDLYFLLLLSHRIYPRTASAFSIILKLVLHIAIIIITLYKTSPEGYIPLALCVTQFVISDIVQYILILYQDDTQVLCCSCTSLKCFYSTDNLQQQQLSPGKQNKSHSSVLQQQYTIYNTYLDGTLCNENSTLKNPRQSLNHSHYIKTYNNLSKDGLIGKRTQQIHKFISSRNGIDMSGKEGPKKMKKMTISSINSFWNINKKDQLKQSGEIQYLREAEEKWQQYLNEIPSGIILIKKNLNQVKFANEFIRQFFLRNFRKFNENEILNMILREIEFKIISHVVNHTSNEKKRITRFSSSAKKQVRESISNAEKKSQKRSSHNINNLLSYNNGGETKNSTGNASNFYQTFKNNGEDQTSQKSPLTQPQPINQTYSNLTPQYSNQLQRPESDKTTTLESILKNFDHGQMTIKDIENSTIEIYTKVLNVENKESISIKGKVLYRSEGDEFMIILEDNTKFENVTNLADRDDYKNRLISSFSHELRTPLNSSMGFLQSALLDETISNMTKETYLLPAYQALKFQYFFISDILDFSQILAKKDLQLNFVKFNISKLISDIRDLYELSFTSKGISLTFSLDNKIQNWEICTDYDRLMQVLVNLINNSLRFTIQGSVTVKINATLQNNLSIHVIDTGDGMNMLQFDQIKQKLSQFGTTGIPITETQHTGFGLTISQIIVSILATEASQDLELRKTQGGGCTFSFCIENILNLQTSFSMTSHNNSKIEVIKSGAKVFARKDIRKQTYAHKALEKTFAKTLQFSSHSLYSKHTKDLKRGSSASISKIEDLKAPIIGNFKAQASVFKKSVLPQPLESPPQTPDLNINFDLNNPLSTLSKRKISLELNKIVTEQNDKPKRKFSNNQYILSDIFGKTQMLPIENEGNQGSQQQVKLPLNPLQIQTTMEDNMQNSGYNLYNNQNSSYSHQKRFFITQSQAIHVSHNNLFLQKDKSHIKYQDQEYEDINRSLMQNDSMMSHTTDYFENRMQKYNFNTLIHSNQAMFSSPAEKKFTNLNIFDSVIENNSVENIPQNFTIEHFTTDGFMGTPMLKASLNLSEKQVDNASTSAQILNPDKSLNLIGNEAETPYYGYGKGQLLGDLEKGHFEAKGKLDRNIKKKVTLPPLPPPPLAPSKHVEIKRPSYSNNTNVKTIIVTPNSKKVTPNKQNNVKFVFQTESKTTSDKDEQSDSDRANKVFAQELKLSRHATTNEATFGVKPQKLNNNDQQDKQDNINQVMRNLISFDPLQHKRQKSKNNEESTEAVIHSPQHYNQPERGVFNSGQNDYSMQGQNGATAKIIEHMNNVFQNQMQLSEHFSEISWQVPQNNLSSNNISNPSGNKRVGGNTGMTAATSINQNIYFNINKMKHATENTGGCVPIIENQMSYYNDTETANFQKEISNPLTILPKMMKNSSWVRKGSLQIQEKEENSGLQDEPQQMSEIIERPITPHQQIFMKCQCKRIMCVDDEIFNIQVLMLLFQKLDFQIEKAFNGRDAITLFTSFYSQKAKYQCESPNCTVFKAIILDCNMPVMNGWDCAKELRNLMNQKKLPSIPIIALTAYVAQQAYNQCIESGMDDVMNKPINIEVLRNTVLNYIRLYETDQKNIQWV